MENLRVSDILKESIVDGIGIRYVIFTQGCYHNCDGCHNPETHDPNGGKPKSIDEIVEEVMSNPLIRGVTFSGGEPFIQPEPLSVIAKLLKAKGKDVWAYTGYTFEQLLEMPETYPLLEAADVLVDGKFYINLRDLTLRFRGSINQRLLDCKASFFAKRAIEIDL